MLVYEGKRKSPETAVIKPYSRLLLLAGAEGIEAYILLSKPL